MKFNLLIFLFLPNCLLAQDFLIQDYGAKDSAIFKIINNNKLVKRIAFSTSFLKTEMINFITEWDVSKNGIIYFTNGINIYQVNKDYTISKKLSSLNNILEFTIQHNNAYIIYNTDTTEAIGDHRYDGNDKFIKLNFLNDKIDTIKLPNYINVSNLCISPNEKFAIFFYTKDLTETTYGITYLMLMDFKNGKIEKIDSANSVYQMGVDGLKHVLYWVDDSSFLYLNGYFKDRHPIFQYSLKSKTRKKVFMEPQIGENWFCYSNGYYYFEGGDGFYKTNGSKEIPVFNDEKLLNVKLLR